MVVNHPHEVKDEIDLPLGNVDPPQMHWHFKLRAIPLKETKTKMKRIQMKKLRSLNRIEGFDYGLPSSPPSNRPIRIQSILGGYNEHHAVKSGQDTTQGQEYIEEVDNILLDVKLRSKSRTKTMM